MRAPRRIGTDLAMLKWDPSGPVVVPLRKSATSLETEELRRKSPQELKAKVKGPKKAGRAK